MSGRVWWGGCGFVLMLCVAGTNAMADGVAGSEWGPVSLGERAAVAEVEQFVRFEAEGGLVGNGGCNSFNGGYEISADRLTIGPLAATRKACAPPAMELEQALFTAFSQVANYQRDGAAMTWFDEGGNEIATFTQRDWD